MDDVAKRAISFETKKSSALSFAAGLPGGVAMLGTVPADVTQYYVHAFRVMQKLAYAYGWQSFLEDCSETDDETLGLMGAFLGVMLGIAGANGALTSFAATVARPAVQRTIASQALTKGTVYPVVKQVMRAIGVHVTKQGFAKTVSKVVPVVGGVVSGGLTFASLTVGSRKLMKQLRELPPARG